MLQKVLLVTVFSSFQFKMYLQLFNEFTFDVHLGGLWLPFERFHVILYKICSFFGLGCAADRAGVSCGVEVCGADGRSKLGLPEDHQSLPGNGDRWPGGGSFSCDGHTLSAFFRLEFIPDQE